MKKLLMLAVVIGLLVSGCTTFNEVVKYNKNHYSQTKEQFDRIQNNKPLLRIGMTEKEVIDLIGEPQRKSGVLFLSDINWVYSSHGVGFELITGIHGRALLLTFRDGKLIRIGKYLI